MTNITNPSINDLRQDAEFAKTVLATPNISPENMRLANDILKAYLLAIKG